MPAAFKKFVVAVKYEAPLVVPLLSDGSPDNAAILDSLREFGADPKTVAVSFKKYTGAGEHEFIKSSDTGLGLELCIKCRRTPDEAAVLCPGIA